ncbi:MAG: RICIN domain-containing protein [Pseudomonadota bacterium]
MKSCYIFLACLFIVSFQPAAAQLPDADKLSNLKKGLNKLVKSYGQLRNADGKCLDVVESEQRKNGGGVRAWDCTDSVTQQWKVDGDKVVSSADKCLSVKGDPAKHGQMTHLWTCKDKSKEQTWKLKGGRLVNNAGKCLDVAGDRKKNGSRIRIADCSDDGDQRWEFKQ